MDLNEINTAANCSTTFLPTKKLTELNIGSVYKIVKLKKCVTMYGSRIVVVINNEFDIFIPERVSKLLLINDKYEKFNEKASKDQLFLKYNGDTKFEFTIME